DAVMPTFTNPNNMSLVTGAPPSVHGISGNFALDRETGAEIMMNDPAMLRSDTLLALMSQAGVPVAAITAKDKLRWMLGRGLAIGDNGICFSSEQADRCTEEEHGIATVEALPDGRPHVLYLEDILNAHFGAGAARVICPITDPFVRHHGALGSFVRVYRNNGAPVAGMAQAIRALPGIDSVLTREEACAVLDLPYDREADLVVT